MAQQQPHDLEIEKYVLGSIMINKQKEVCKITEDDFYNSLHKRIYNIINDLFIKDKNINVMAIGEVLFSETKDAYDIVTRVSETASIGGRFDNALETLKTYSLRRDIIKKAYELNSLAYEEIDGIMELKNEAMAIMDLKISEADNKKSMLENVDDVLEDIRKQRKAIDDKKLFSQFIDLDKMMAGFHPEELTIIAARPAVGKTAFALQLMLNLASKNNHCYFISREMSCKSLTLRLLSNLTEINGNKFRLAKSLTKEDLDNISSKKEVLQWLPLNLDDKTSTIQEVRLKCRDLYNDNKLDILIIDYLQLLKSSGRHSSRREEIESISRSLKEISMEFNIPVIALSQLSRASTDNNEPQLHHLRESGSLEQDADNVIFLHKPEDATETLKLIIAKQRNGSTGYIHLINQKDTLKFTNASRR